MIGLYHKMYASQTLARCVKHILIAWWALECRGTEGANGRDPCDGRELASGHGERRARRNDAVPRLNQPGTCLVKSETAGRGSRKGQGR